MYGVHYQKPIQNHIKNFVGNLVGNPTANPIRITLARLWLRAWSRTRWRKRKIGKRIGNPIGKRIGNPAKTFTRNQNREPYQEPLNPKPCPIGQDPGESSGRLPRSAPKPGPLLWLKTPSFSPVGEKLIVLKPLHPCRRFLRMDAQGNLGVTSEMDWHELNGVGGPQSSTAARPEEMGWDWRKCEIAMHYPILYLIAKNPRSWISSNIPAPLPMQWGLMVGSKQASAIRWCNCLLSDLFLSKLL